jgi:hypothetical protein
MQLAIDNPCHVDWARMTHREASKRFCGDCRKHVHDLSSMSLPDARALLKSKATEELCIRYFVDSRGEPVFKPDVPAHRLRRAVVVAIAVAAPLSLTACMGLRRMEPPPVVAPQPFVDPPHPRPAGPSRASSTTPRPAPSAIGAR